MLWNGSLSSVPLPWSQSQFLEPACSLDTAWRPWAKLVSSLLRGEHFLPVIHSSVPIGIVKPPQRELTHPHSINRYTNRLSEATRVVRCIIARQIYRLISDSTKSAHKTLSLSPTNILIGQQCCIRLAMPDSQKRPVRVGGVSGGFSDRIFAMSRMAASGDVDVLVGDWLAEMTMAEHGALKAERLSNTTAAGLTDGSLPTIEEVAATAQFSVNFVDCFKPAIPDIKKRGIKVAVNAGSCDAEVLAKLTQKLCDDAGHSMKVAWISGDDVTDRVKSMLASGEKFESLNLKDGSYLGDWGFDLVSAQAYLGGLGIAEALRKGADIVVCGRVADAAPTIGAAA